MGHQNPVHHPDQIESAGVATADLIEDLFDGNVACRHLEFPLQIHIDNVEEKFGCTYLCNVDAARDRGRHDNFEP